ncbi:MAG TPA: hemerythrin domain-containing protein, partial [Quisquiliibacterium sp.]|nr:hemerythrin domain-containing protein [Quisquiliibacterium sp.]
IAREEAELLPMAARLLGDTDLERIGRAMRQRRGV